MFDLIKGIYKVFMFILEVLSAFGKCLDKEATEIKEYQELYLTKTKSLRNKLKSLEIEQEFLNIKLKQSKDLNTTSNLQEKLTNIIKESTKIKQEIEDIKLQCKLEITERRRNQDE